MSVPSPSLGLRLALLLALAASGCGPAPITPTKPAASGALAAGAPRRASPSPRAQGPSTAPGSPAPIPSAGADPTAPASPAARPGPTPDSRLARIELKLLRVAQVGFGQLRGRLASEGAFDGPAGAALVGNNGAGIISNNGSGIVSDHGGGLISNNGGALIGDAGGALAGTPGAYRLAQATPTPTPLGLPLIADQAQGAERLVADRDYLDDMRLRTYLDPTVAAGFETIRVVGSRAGAPFYERRREIRALHPSGKPSRTASATVEILAGGRFGYRQAEAVERDEAGKVLRGAFEPESYAVDLATGGVTHFDAFSYDTAARTGAFAFRYAAFGLTERGTLRNMRVDAEGGVSYVFWDLLAVDDGDSEVVDASGATLFTRSRRAEAGMVNLTYDLGDGLVLALVRGEASQATGRLSEGGVAIADVVQQGRADGSVTFTLTFDAEPARPLTIGYGLSGDAPTSVPSQPARWMVAPVAGGAVAGHANAARADARFSRPFGLVASRLSGKKIFVADGANHRVRAIVATTTFEAQDVAGGAESAFADGPAAAARFRTPYGLAADADDTLYVSDVEDHRIRVVAPDGTVSTLAGTGTPGFADGAAGVGLLGNPGGLALDAASGRLYVADTGNHAIRMIETRGAARGQLTTLVGGGPLSKGFADGPKAAARFDRPRGVALAPDGSLYVADGGNHRIRRVTADGTATTVAGLGDPAGFLHDGPALEAGFDPPRALAVGPDGTLYFTTALDVQALTPAGRVRSVAGTAVQGQRDGVAAFATFTDLQGLFMSANGTLYVADATAIRAVRPPTSPSPAP